MNLKGTHTLKAPKDRIWEALNSPDILFECTPGCKQMIAAEDGSYDVEMEVGVAAVKGRYKGKITITDRVPASQYKLAVTGSGNSGFLNAEGVVQLKEVGDETLIEYSGVAHIGGLIAGVGQRVMEGVAKLIVGQFFKSLEKAVQVASDEGAEEAPDTGGVP